MGLTVSSWDSSSISTLFSSLSSKSATDGVSSILNSSATLLSDYYSIQNGSYKKLLSAYYDSVDTSSTSSTDDDDETSTLSTIQESANSLSTSTYTLLNKTSSSVFEPDSDGEYDTDAIYDAVDDYVTAYNSVVKNGASSTVSSIKSAVSSMKSTTNMNSSALESIGITVSDSGYLSIDEDTFKSSDMSTVKSIFNTTGGYAYTIGSKATTISSAASTYTSGYTSSGTLSTSDIVSSFTSYV